MNAISANEPGLPDDPRELHQLALDVLIAARLSDAMTDALAFAELISAAAGRDATNDPVRGAIEVAAMRVLDGLHEIERAMKRTRELCRHGSGNYDKAGRP